jgi:7-carboxy-7-deazaguanine synthase
MNNRYVNISDGTSLPLVEEFFSLQGEGFHSGKAAYFIRLGGCDVGCRWCDSRFAWDPDLFPLVDTQEIVRNALLSGADSVVVTGGEPLMWNLDLLCHELKREKLSTFIETSGTYNLSGEWDWICLSPKKNLPPIDEVCKLANELKVIIEEKNDFEWAERYRLKVNEKCLLFLQPEWSRFGIIVPEIVKYVKQNPSWRISLQIHKYMRIP